MDDCWFAYFELERSHSHNNWANGTWVCFTTHSPHLVCTMCILHIGIELFARSYEHDQSSFIPISNNQNRDTFYQQLDKQMTTWKYLINEMPPHKEDDPYRIYTEFIEYHRHLYSIVRTDQSGIFLNDVWTVARATNWVYRSGNSGVVDSQATYTFDTSAGSGEVYVNKNKRNTSRHHVRELNFGFLLVFYQVYIVASAAVKTRSFLSKHKTHAKDALCVGHRWWNFIVDKTMEAISMTTILSTSTLISTIFQYLSGAWVIPLEYDCHRKWILDLKLTILHFFLQIGVSQIHSQQEHWRFIAVSVHMWILIVSMRHYVCDGTWNDGLFCVKTDAVSG